MGSQRWPEKDQVSKVLRRETEKVRCRGIGDGRRKNTGLGWGQEIMEELGGR